MEFKHMAKQILLTEENPAARSKAAKSVIWLSGWFPISKKTNQSILYKSAQNTGYPDIASRSLNTEMAGKCLAGVPAENLRVNITPMTW